VPRSKTAPAQIKTDERRTAITRARAQGKSYAELARQFGLSVRRIRDILGEEFKRLSTERNAAAVEAFQRTMERLDDLLEAVWGDALQGDPKAVQAALSVIDRQARLHGLVGTGNSDAPVTSQVNHFYLLEQRARDLGVTVDALRGPPVPALPAPAAIDAEVVDR
jgi:hypothetical protein